jgi:hypothetical protein
LPLTARTPPLTTSHAVVARVLTAEGGLRRDCGRTADALAGASVVILYVTFWAAGPRDGLIGNSAAYEDGDLRVVLYRSTDAIYWSAGPEIPDALTSPSAEETAIAREAARRASTLREHAPLAAARGDDDTTTRLQAAASAADRVARRPRRRSSPSSRST